MTFLKSKLVWLVTALTVLRLLAAAGSGLVPDESYYWLWAQHPAAGYYDHPPMVAWWIMASLPWSSLGVRLPFILSFLVLCGLMYDAARVMFSTEVAKRTVIWLNACLLLSIGGVIATPDPPSVLMWAGGLWALARLQASDNARWWLIFGLFAGLGFEAKYTNLFLGLGVVVWFILDKPARRWLKSPFLYAGAVVAAVMMAPNLLWNASHHWLSIAKQFGRLEAGTFTVKYLIEFVVSQPLLLNPLIFVFVVVGVGLWWRGRGDSRLNLLVALPLPLLAYFLLHVFHDRIQGNWPAPVYPGLVLLAAFAAEGVTGKGLTRLRSWTAPVGITIICLVLIGMALGDRLPAAGPAVLGRGWDKAATQIAAKARTEQAGWIATTDYDLQGELSYHADPLPVIAVSERTRYNWPTPEASVAGQRAIIVVSANHGPDLNACFSGLRDLGTVSRLKKAGRKTDLHLWSGLIKTPGCELPN